MRGTRRQAFTLIELTISLVCATLLLGMVSMAMRVSLQARNQRADQDQALNEGREALDTIERLVSRAVELQEWNPNTNTPRISDATGEAGDSFTVNTTGTINLGSGAKTFNDRAVITHDGTSWDFRANPSIGFWDPVTNNPTLNPGGGGTGGPKDTMIVQSLVPPTGPWLYTGPPGLNPGGPASGFMPGDILLKRPGPPGPPGGRWTFVTFRPGIPTSGPGAFNDSVGVVGDVRFVTVPRPVVPPPAFPVWTPTFSADLGSGLMHFTAGDILVKTPFGWRKLANQCAIKNFKNAGTGADDDISGIQFFADVDPTNSPIGDLDAGRKILEWVWIWWDSRIDTDQLVQPYDRRGPLKIAIFRAFPSGNGGNEHDTWTRNSHPLFNLISTPTQFRRAYHTTAGNFGTLQMKVQSYTSAVNGTASQLTWTKRVAVTGGVFMDRTGELAAAPGNPWDDVAPGSRFLTATGAPARFTNVPSYTFCRSIYAANAGATTDEQGRPFTFNPNVPTNINQMRRRSVGWQTRFAAGNVKNDHVVQPR